METVGVEVRINRHETAWVNEASRLILNITVQVYVLAMEPDWVSADESAYVLVVVSGAGWPTLVFSLSPSPQKWLPHSFPVLERVGETTLTFLSF